jgi:hypothetical protein
VFVHVCPIPTFGNLKPSLNSIKTKLKEHSAGTTPAVFNLKNKLKPPKGEEEDRVIYL